MDNSELYKTVTSDTNIFSAIYSLESYIFEKNLLQQADLELYYQLKDKYDDSTIKKVIKQCKSLLDKVLLKDKKFDIQVFFKAKKYDKKHDSVEFRPLHTADLITQICIVSLLNVIMFSTNENKKRQLSDISQLLPSNFYGNLPSEEYENIFYHWQDKYKQYTEDIMAEYDSIRNKSTLKYEVTLDLEKFFPSVDPSFIYNYILEKTSSIYLDNEREFLKQILKKILCFNVTNLSTQDEIDEYYSTSNFLPDTESPKLGTDIMNVGIPQGLPQAYFFGNIAMIPISKEFNKMFPGKSFYYVDDSVIYTDHKNANPTTFQISLEALNKNIQREIKKYTTIKVCKTSNIEYEISVHRKEKSSSAEVDSSIKMGRSFLAGVVIETSRLSFEIFNTTNEIQDISTLEKILHIHKALEVEIINVKKHIESMKVPTEEGCNIDKYAFEIYLKSLIRYKKFFGYRKRILEFRQHNDVEKIKNNFKQKYIDNPLNTPDDFESVFQYFDEDIFLPEAMLILNVLENDKRKSFIDKIVKFEKKLASKLTKETLYFSNNCTKNLEYSDVRFSTLKKTASDKLGNFTRKPEKLIKSKLKLIRDKESEIWLGFDKNYTYNKCIYNHSNTYKINILNSYISTIFNLDTTNDFEFIKLDKRPIKYYELRILMYIRNKNVSLDDFTMFLTSAINIEDGENYEKVDFSLIEVLNLFKTHVRSAAKIDNLILVHKYVSSVWKNGSRFLYFYTLHNQEHSIELIKSAVHICKVFDFFQIKSIDYYILFLACYLHDISMILQPNIDSFLENNSKTDESYSSFLKFKQVLFNDSEIDEYHFNNKSNIKKIMKKAFEEVNGYFESLTRDTHVTSSADFIKTSFDLNFIDITIRGIVAAISAAHGDDTIDIYDLKSNAKSDVVSEKHMMILLRIADLLDIAKDRVSLNILDANITNMPEKAQYHWITHSAIDEFEIKSEYDFINNNSDDIKFTSVLKRQNFIETILVQIYLNTSNLTSINSLKCNAVSSRLDLENRFIEIEIGSDKACESKCNFLCKWICHKNEYLLPELNALQQYIGRTPNLKFTTNIKLILNFDKAKNMKSNYFDIINKQLQ